MAPQIKKSTSKQSSAAKASSAKMASTASRSTPKMALSSMPNPRASQSSASAENVVKLGSEAVRDFFTGGAGEAQKAQEKAFAFSREGAQNFARSAETASQGLNDLISLIRDNIEACMESGNISANMAQEIGTELFQYANDSFAQQIEISKEVFSCRTVNDLFELQSRLARTTLDSFFSQSSKLSEMFFRYAGEASEPLNERLADAMDRLSRGING